VSALDPKCWVSKTIGYQLWLKTDRWPGSWAVAPFLLKGSPTRQGNTNVKQKETKQNEHEHQTTVRAPDFISPIFPFLHKIRGIVKYAFKGQLMLVNGSFFRNIYAFRGEKRNCLYESFLALQVWAKKRTCRAWKELPPSILP
jgi:hypothetical protein